jgi:hypothetical protein
MSANGRAARAASSLPAGRAEWSSFVTRCVRSWVAARTSATDFLAAWTPLRLPDPPQSVPARPGPTRREPSSVRSHSRRQARYPSAVVASPVPAAAAGGADALRERYPLVSALLIEMAAQARRGTAVAPRTQQRR